MNEYETYCGTVSQFSRLIEKLAKLNVAGSNPVTRFIQAPRSEQVHPGAPSLTRPPAVRAIATEADGPNTGDGSTGSNQWGWIRAWTPLPSPSHSSRYQLGTI
jgi:hypothetical protein